MTATLSTLDLPSTTLDGATVGTRRGRAILRAFLRRPIGVASAIVLLGLLVYAIAVPLLAPAGSTDVDIEHEFESPGLFGGDTKALGTDHLGRSLGVLVAKGLRTSLEVGLTVVIVTAAVGWLLGALGAYHGRWADSLVGRFLDSLNVFPPVLLAVAVVSATGGGLLVVIIVLSLEGLVIFGRTGRSMALSGKHADYVAACKSFGGGSGRILTSHLARVSLPGIFSVALVQLPQVILLESSLSFVGYGIQPPNTSIGLIVADERTYLTVQPWPVLFSGGVLAAACVSLALIGVTVSEAVKSS